MKMKKTIIFLSLVSVLILAGFEFLPMAKAETTATASIFNFSVDAAWTIGQGGNIYWTCNGIPSDKHFRLGFIDPTGKKWFLFSEFYRADACDGVTKNYRVFPRPNNLASTNFPLAGNYKLAIVVYESDEKTLYQPNGSMIFSQYIGKLVAPNPEIFNLAVAIDNTDNRYRTNWPIGAEGKVVWVCKNIPADKTFRLGFYDASNGGQGWLWSEFYRATACDGQTNNVRVFPRTENLKMANFPPSGSNYALLGVKVYEADQKTEYLSLGKPIEKWLSVYPFKVATVATGTNSQTQLGPTVSVTAPVSVNKNQIFSVKWQSTGATTCAGKVSGEFGYSVNFAPTGTSGSNQVTASGVGDYNFCLTCSGPDGSKTGCANVRVETPAPVSTTTSPVINPKAPTVSLITVSNLNNSKWGVGNTKNIRWNFSNFTQASAFRDGVSLPIKTVSLALINPTTKAVCPMTDVAGKTLGGVASGNGQQSGLANLNVGLGFKLLERIKNGEDIAKCFSLQGKTYKTQIAICPTVSSAGVYWPALGSVCGYSPTFELVMAESGTWDQPAGQGCVKDECVCVNGKRTICDSPMKSGVGCPASNNNYGSCATVSLVNQFLASVSLLFK